MEAFLSPTVDPVIIISGTTCSGKTAIAERLCKQIGSEIISADSRCFFRDILIGNGKYTMDRSVRYHMVDVVNADRYFTVSSFLAGTQESIRSIKRRGISPIICGGSMLHIDRLMNGMGPNGRPDRTMRLWLDEFINEFGPVESHNLLLELDHDIGKSISSHDRRRVRRGLENCISSNDFEGPIAGLDRPYIPFFMDRSDEELISRIHDRARTMIDRGWVEEARSISEGYLSRDIPGLVLSGIEHIFSFIDGSIDEEKLIEDIVKANMQLVRYQRKWLKRLPLERIDLSSVEEDELMSYIQARIDQEDE